MARTIVQNRVCAMPLWKPPRCAGSKQAALAIDTRRWTSILGRCKIRDRQRFQRPQERKAESVMRTRLASLSGLGHIPTPGLRGFIRQQPRGNFTSLSWLSTMLDTAAIPSFRLLFPSPSPSACVKPQDDGANSPS